MYVYVVAPGPGDCAHSAGVRCGDRAVGVPSCRGMGSGAHPPVVGGTALVARRTRAGAGISLAGGCRGACGDGPQWDGHGPIADGIGAAPFSATAAPLFFSGGRRREGDINPARPARPRKSEDMHL